MSRPLRIDEMWAWVSLSENGYEGVIALNIGASAETVPLVGADREMMDSLRPYVVMLNEQHGVTATLVKFTKREELEVIGGGRVQ